MKSFIKNFDKYIFLYRKTNLNRKIIILHLCFSKMVENLKNFNEEKRYRFINYDVDDSTIARRILPRRRRRRY
jgi:hypothetical protein